MEELDIDILGIYDNKALAEQAAAKFNSTIDTKYKYFKVEERDGKYYLIVSYRDVEVTSTKTYKTLIFCILLGISIYLILKNKTK